MSGEESREREAGAGDAPRDPDAAPAAGDEPELDVAGGGTPEPGERPGVVRRLYDWVLHWAGTPYGPAALFVLAFAESSFFPIPPDPLLVALCLGMASRALRFAALATLGSVLGGMLGYWIGAVGWGVAQDFFFTYVPGVSPASFEEVRAGYDRWGFWLVFTAGFSPIPYKLFTLSSGVFGIHFGLFVLASALSRGLRFFLVAGLIYRYGPPIAGFIDRHFDRLAWAFGILLVMGFVVVEFLL